MVKKLTIFALVSFVSIVPTSSMAAVGGVVQVGTTAKVSSSSPVIRLASNDITQMHTSSRQDVSKAKASDESPIELSKIPPQAWLILTALFCFVMRSSRRVV